MIGWMQLYHMSLGSAGYVAGSAAQRLGLLPPTATVQQQISTAQHVAMHTKCLLPHDQATLPHNMAPPAMGPRTLPATHPQTPAAGLLLPSAPAGCSVLGCSRRSQHGQHRAAAG
jgi:hypothetical protein